MVETLRMALKALIQNRLQALLTLCGMSVGVAMVVVVSGLGRGAQLRIESQIERGELKVSLLFRKFKTREIPADEIRGFDPEGRLFANLNRPEDLTSIPQPEAGR